MTTRPATVEFFAEALADWLASFTVPASLATAMVDACLEGAAWAAAVAGAAARAAGWSDAGTVAWGLGVGAHAGAIAAARRSLSTGAGVSRPAAGPSPAAQQLLAADGLIAAGHEALSSLDPDRLRIALRALDAEFGDGGAWGVIALEDDAGVGWRALIPLALAPAVQSEPDGAWPALAAEWRAWGSGAGPAPRPSAHAKLDASTRRLLDAVADRAADVDDD